MKVRIDELKDRVSFWTPTRSQGSPFLEQLLEASIDEMPLRITYASKDGTSERVVQPIGIYASNGFWYFPSYCFRKEGFLLFRADRIRSLERAESAHPSKNFKNYTIADWLLAGQEREAGPMTMKLRVKLTPAGVRTYERSNGQDANVRLNDDGSGLLDTDMHRSNLTYFSKYFLSLGADALVEEPWRW
jgi:predicted DNA-binding transcriptional regulator YafY